MTLIRLEILRMARTRRWLLMVGVYAFFGLVGPLMARYLTEIVESFGGDEISIVAADPTPLDGVVQFVSNAGQLGVLAVIVVAAAALALDARPEIAAFLRTRVADARTLIVPRVLVVTVTAALALAVGTALAWVVTAAVLGGLPAGPMLLGTLLGALFLAVVVALVALVATLTRGVVGTVFASIAAAIAMPVLALIPPLAPWLPSQLMTAVAGLVDGAPATDYVRAVVTSLVAIAAFLTIATHRLNRREL